MQNRLHYFVEALRLRTLALSVGGILTGGVLAAVRGYSNGGVFMAAIATAACLQITANLANDLGDFVKGTDNENRLGHVRGLQAHVFSQYEYKVILVIFGCLAISCGLLAITWAFETITDWRSLTMIGLGAASLLAALKYTMGRNAYGYLGFGEVFVFLFFGLLSVAGSYFLLAGTLTVDVFLPGISIGLLSSAVLNVNNTRDIANDRQCGKHTLAARLGECKAKWLHTAMVTLAVGAAFWAASLWGNGLRSYAFLLATPVLCWHVVQVWRLSGSQLNGQLKVLSLGTLLFGMLLSLGG